MNEPSSTPATVEIKVEIKIEGMTCEGCVASLKNALSRVIGVSNVEVSLEQKRAIVAYDPQQVSTEKFSQVVADSGYQVLH